MEKKMDPLTKVKLIYSGELIIIALAFLIIGILEVTRIIGINDIVRQIFNWATPFGAMWLIIDLIWALKSEKRRKKVSLFDKFSLMPVIIYVITIDIIMFINYNALEPRIYQLFIGIALISISVVYIIQGIYHWYHPLQSLLDELEQERIDKITYKVLEIKEDGSIIALHIETNEKCIFSSDSNIKENVNELFCLDLYPNVTPTKYIDNN